MSCGRTSKLEALVLGELPQPAARELRLHARSCSRCRHELNWLESEQTLFRQRAGREEVAHLWAGVMARSPVKAPRAWSRVLVAIAASALVVLAGGRVVLTVAHHASHTDFAIGQQSEALESFGTASAGGDLCSMGGPGSPGFHCSAPLPASVLASR